MTDPRPSTASDKSPVAIRARSLTRIYEVGSVQVTGIDGIDLSIPAGELVVLKGDSGSGKSTLAHVLSGRDGYQVTAGRVQFDGNDLLAMETEERAHAGVFLAMQYPVELPGVNNTVFVNTAMPKKDFGRRRWLSL